MRFGGLAAALVLLRLATETIAQQVPAVSITGVNVVDVAGGRILSNRTVTIKGDAIVSVGAGAPSRGNRIVDGSGKFLVPGLWDMHAHLQAGGPSGLDLYLANGVTGIRDMGADVDFILPMRERVRRGESSGPQIVAAGPILDNAPPDWPFRQRVTNATEARAAVRDLKKRGVDLIKVHTNTPRDAFFAIADEAPKARLPFAGHVPRALTVAEAVASGMKSIEHLGEFRLFRECGTPPAPYDAETCRALFDQLAAKGVWQTPTADFFRVLPEVFLGKPLPHAEYASDSLLDLTRKNREASKLDDAALSGFRAMARTSVTVIRDMVARGVPFLAGCDGTVPGFCVHDELQALNEAGLSPLQALQTATINPARFLGREKTEGTINAGSRADLVLLEADPLIDIRNTRRIAAVVVRGQVLLKADLDRLLAAHRR
jgi:imidazolonepropionase-like amidohydrolase